MQSVQTTQLLMENQLQCRNSASTLIKKESLKSLSNKVKFCIKEFKGLNPTLPDEDQKIIMGNVKEVVINFNKILQKEDQAIQGRCLVFRICYKVYKYIFNIKKIKFISFSAEVKFPSIPLERPPERKENENVQSAEINKTRKKYKESVNIPRSQPTAQDDLRNLIAQQMVINSSKKYVHFVSGVFERLVEEQRTDEISIETIKQTLLEEVDREYGPEDREFTAEEMRDVEKELLLFQSNLVTLKAQGISPCNVKRMAAEIYDYATYDQTMIQKNLEALKKGDPAHPYTMRRYRLEGYSMEDHPNEITRFKQAISKFMSPPAQLTEQSNPSLLKAHDQWNQLKGALDKWNQARLAQRAPTPSSPQSI